MTASAASGTAKQQDEPRVTLLTRKACHLCEPVRAVVTAVCADGGHSWRELDVDSDPDLRSEYGEQVPVVLVDGEFLASYSLDAPTLSTALRR